MAEPLPVEPPELQAKVLRKLADRLERGEPGLSAELQEALAQELEDRIDRELIRERRDEPTIPLSEVKARLGL